MTLSLVATADTEAEQSVLGAILIDENVLDDIGFLHEEDFALDRHRMLYRITRYLQDKNKTVDIVTVTEEYHKYNLLDQSGGVQYLADLANSVPSVRNAVHYAKIVHKKALGRRGHNVGQRIANLSINEFEKLEDYHAEIERLTDTLKPQQIGKMETLKEIEVGYMTHLITPIETIQTGFKRFDEWSNGLGRGDLFVSAGRPSAGKTALLLQRIRGILENQTSGQVLLWSQEMSKYEVIDRMIASATGINYSWIRKKLLKDKPQELEVAKTMYRKLSQKPLHVNDAAGATIQEVRSTARAYKRKYGKIDLIAIDYLQIMRIPQGPNETRSQAIGNVTQKAKQLARELDCTVMLLAQMSRESEQKKKPQLSDLKESGSIEQDADNVEFLWHNDKDTIKIGRVVQQFIAKGRNIGINDFRLLFRGHLQKFEEMPDRP